MRNLHLTTLSLVMLLLAGCGSTSILESKHLDYKADAAKAPALDVPPDLTTPTADDRYNIPDGAINTTNYSDFAKGNAPAQTKPSSVLPESKNVRLERNGTQRWLVVDDKAENLWPVIKAFLVENGFVIKTEDPKAGVIETDWASTDPQTPESGVRGFLNKMLKYDSGESAMYHVRLERSKDGASTEIYLTQYAKELMLTEDKSTFKYQSRPNDPEKEATMLQKLMAKLSPAVESQSQEQAQGASSPAQGADGAARLQTLTNGSKVIVVNEPFDRSWRRVGLALDYDGYTVEDKDRVNGIYYVRIDEAAKQKTWMDKLAFWRGDEKANPVRYQVTVHENNAVCEVAVNNGKGESNATTQQIIDVLYKALGK